jgi:uncharacterized protein with FMN-binding domain
VEVLEKLGADYTRNGQAIKLWADMGELEKALEWAEGLARSNPAAAHLAAGDACRRAGKVKEAIACYKKVLDLKGESTRDDPVNRKRAQASLEAARLFEGLDLSKIADGTYKASSIAYAGPLEVTVTVQEHRIESVKVTKHQEKQFYASLTEVPPQIVTKQAVTGIDMTTGATVTSEAIVNAAAKALDGAARGR